MGLQTSQPLVVNDDASVASDDTSSQDSMLSYIKKSGPSFKLNFDEDPTFWKLNDSKYGIFLWLLKVRDAIVLQHHPERVISSRGTNLQKNYYYGFSLIF